MSKIYHVLFFLLTLILATGCSEEITVEQTEQQPKLIVNAILNPDEDNVVLLNMSEAETVRDIRDARIEVIVNGQTVETLTQGTPSEVSLENNHYYYNAKHATLAFALKTKFKPGEQVTIRATAEGNTYKAEATTTIPERPLEVSVDTAHIVRNSSDYIEVRVKLKDFPQSGNYYRIYLRERYITRGVSEYTGRDTTVIYNHIPETDSNEDYILNDGQPQSGTDIEEELTGTEIENKFMLFTDRLLSNESIIKFYVNKNSSQYPLIGIDITKPVHFSGELYIGVAHIDEQLFAYWKALDGIMQTDSDDLGISEMIILPTNVEHGIGYVGAESVSYKTFSLPEEVWGEYYSRNMK